MKRGRKKQDWVRLGGIGVFLAVAIISFLYANVDWLFDRNAVPGAADPGADTAVHFIDCGQGDSALIVSDGAVALIDAGTREAGDGIVTYLKENGITKIDYLILTHPHEDHIGGAVAVLEAFPVDQIYMSKPTEGTEPTTSTYMGLLTKIRDSGCTIHTAKPGEHFSVKNFDFSVLGPLEEYRELNNQSLVLRAEYGQISFLFTGDQEEKGEEALIEEYGNTLSSTVLKAGHHGSRSSSGTEFLKIVRPHYGVISCGVDNTYGHPHEETLHSFEQYGIAALRTDLSGTIRMKTDGKELTVEEMGK